MTEIFWNPHSRINFSAERQTKTFFDILDQAFNASLYWRKASTPAPLSHEAGNTKRGKYHCSVDLLFDWIGISSLTTDIFCFYLQNRRIQNSQTGGQLYSDTSPFSIPCTRKHTLSLLFSLSLEKSAQTTSSIDLCRSIDIYTSRFSQLAASFSLCFSLSLTNTGTHIDTHTHWQT
jgi:hypothetical protein